jgi:agmatinase
VAADVVELAPIPGLHHADFTVARLVYELIGLALRAERATRG